jgi:hypothetical protein
MEFIERFHLSTEMNLARRWRHPLRYFPFQMDQKNLGSSKLRRKAIGSTLE